MGFPSKEQVEHLKKTYAGKRIQFKGHIKPDPAPLTYNELGTCIDVDDGGGLQMQWDSGRSLSLLPGADSWVIYADGK